MVFALFRNRSNAKLIDRLHGDIVAAALRPLLYGGFGVEDTFEGRFEMLALHASLVLRRLNAGPAPGPDVAQDLVDAVFAGLDSALREAGIGDLAVPKRMKALAEAFFGRAAAYDAALKSPEHAELEAALARNAFAGRVGSARALAAYVKAAAERLDASSVDQMLAAPLRFPDPPVAQAAAR